MTLGLQIIAAVSLVANGAMVGWLITAYNVVADRDDEIVELKEDYLRLRQRIHDDQA